MNGFDCFVNGFSLIAQPGLRRYVVIPTVLNTLVLVLLVSYSVSRFEAWVGALAAYLPDFLDFLYWLIWGLALVVVVFMLFYLFVMIANLIASPFNAVLAEKVEEHLTGEKVAGAPTFMQMVMQSLRREVSKALYILPRMLGLLVLSVIPVLNTVAPVLWLVFGGWMMAVQFCDYAADNNQVTFSELRQRLGGSRWQALLFGFPAYLLLAVPLLNVFVLSAMVAAGTAFWVHHLRQPNAGSASIPTR